MGCFQCSKGLQPALARCCDLRILAIEIFIAYLLNLFLRLKELLTVYKKSDIANGKHISSSVDTPPFNR